MLNKFILFDYFVYVGYNLSNETMELRNKDCVEERYC